jgi:hypothetical protein
VGGAHGSSKNGNVGSYADLRRIRSGQNRIYRDQEHIKAPDVLVSAHGPGRKHERVIEFEAWQQEIVTSHPGDFARGLCHSDGCR